MPSLPNLAPELIQHISSVLGKEDLLTLRLVSKHLNTIIEPQALHSLALYILRDNLDAGRSLLTTLSSGNHHKATWATKHLRIAALCPVAYCTSGPPCCRWVEERSVWTVVRETEDDDPGKAKVVEGEMRRLIEGAVGSLKGLRSFWWSICPNDPEFTHSAVMNGVRTLPNLDSIHIDLCVSTTPLQLDSLKNLTKIVMTGYCVDFLRTIVDPLTIAISNSPRLASLEFGPSYTNVHPVEVFDLPTLHRLFKRRAVEDAVQLKELDVKGCWVLLDQTTLPHVRYLTSLTLINVMVDTSRIAEGDPIKEESSTHDEIWAALTKAGVRLQSVSVDNVGMAFLQYLSSYSGLKKIQLVPENFSQWRRGESEGAAGRFYEECLIHHVESIEELDVQALYEGRWCLVDENVGVLCQCPALRVLTGCIVLAEDVKPLIDTVVAEMPLLKELRIVGVSDGDHDSISTRLEESMVGYRPSTGVRWLPLIQAGSHRARMKRYALGGLIRS